MRNNNFFNNLFGTIAQNGILGREPGNISFIPTDNQGHTITIKGQNAVWLGLKTRQMQYWAYMYCTPLASVIDNLAEADIAGKLLFLRSKGKGRDDEASSPYAMKLKTLFDNPNPLQDWWDFRAEQVVIKKKHGFCPVLIVKPAGFNAVEDASLMFNLDPRYFNVEDTGKLYKQKKIKDIITQYTITTPFGETLPIPPENILILKDSFVRDENYKNLVPVSKMIGLDMAVSNYCAAMEADNVLLRKRGPLGAWTSDKPADSVVGNLAMTPTEQKSVQDSLATMGLSWDKFQHAVTAVPVKWQPTSFNVSELGTSETIIKATRAICHRYNYSYILLEDSDAKFANGNQAHKALYQNNVIPNNERDMLAYDNYFLMAENNVKIITDYSELAIMQEDQKLAAEALKYKNEANQIAYLNDVITLNQWLTDIGLDTVDGGDLYYSQSALKLSNDAAKQAMAAAKNKNNVAPKN